MDQDNGKKWEMPEPIFRKSTGELVKPSESDYFDPEPDTLEPNSPEEPEADTAPAPDPPPAAEPAAPAVPAAPEVAGADDPLAKLYDPPQKATGSTPEASQPASAPAAVPAVVVEPQPFISEQFTAEKIVVDKDASASGGKDRSVWVVIALLVLLGAAGAIAALIYFMFYAARTDTSGF